MSLSIKYSLLRFVNKCLDTNFNLNAIINIPLGIILLYFPIYRWKE